MRRHGWSRGASTWNNDMLLACTHFMGTDRIRLLRLTSARVWRGQRWSNRSRCPYCCHNSPILPHQMCHSPLTSLSCRLKLCNSAVRIKHVKLAYIPDFTAKTTLYSSNYSQITYLEKESLLDSHLLRLYSLTNHFYANLKINLSCHRPQSQNSTTHSCDHFLRYFPANLSAVAWVVNS